MCQGQADKALLCCAALIFAISVTSLSSAQHWRAEVITVAKTKIEAPKTTASLTVASVANIKVEPVPMVDYTAERSELQKIASRAEKSRDKMLRALAQTGFDPLRLAQKIDANRGDIRRYMGQGGPLITKLPKLEQVQDAGIEKAFFSLREAADKHEKLKALAAKLPIAAPMADYRLTSGFGHRHDPISGQKAMHEGLDFAYRMNTPVMVSAPGVVTFAGRMSNYGRIVEVDHGMGFTTRYAHLNRIDVRVGQQINRGRVIGLLGNSGRSTGPHLHYEVRHNDRPLDPMRFIRAGYYVREVLLEQQASLAE